jgi:hypothetical protein
MLKLRVKRHAVTQPIDQSYKLIPLTQGQNAIVDTSDYDWLNQWNWYANWSEVTHSFYAVRTLNHVRMAREILGCDSTKEADHINHDTLDNRRINLRKVNKQENATNKRMYQSNTSGFIGVSWNKHKQKWTASIGYRGEIIYVGAFPSSEEAARARDKLAKMYHGEFAVLNFPS